MENQKKHAPLKYFGKRIKTAPVQTPAISWPGSDARGNTQGTQKAPSQAGGALSIGKPVPNIVNAVQKRVGLFWTWRYGHARTALLAIRYIPNRKCVYYKP